MNLTLILPTWTIWRAPTNASKWRMGFNSAFKGLIKAGKLQTSFLSDFLLVFIFSHDVSARFHLVASPLLGLREILRFYEVTSLATHSTLKLGGPELLSLPVFSCSTYPAWYLRHLGCFVDRMSLTR